MPTYFVLQQFWKDYDSLTNAEKHAFRTAVNAFVEDLRNGNGFRNGLRVKGVQGTKNIYEMTWANDGRATFSYGDSVVNGEPHIVWHRIGGHDIFGR